MTSPRPFTAAARPLLVIAAACWATIGPAADNATRFVERLREAGHADLVLEYLDRAESDPLVSDAFRRRIPYERLATLYAQAVAVADPAGRVAALEALAPELEKLAPTSDDARRLLTDATDRLATAAADGARRAALEAARKPEGAERKSALRAARGQLEAARERLTDAERLLVAEREGLKGVQPASPEGRRRQDLGARLGLVRLLNARLLHEIAETHASDKSQRNKLNLQAAKQLGELYDKYSKWGVGLYAQLYEGRCYRLVGKRQLAASALEGLTAQPAPTPELRRIVTLAHAENAALLTDTGDAQRALGRAREWLEGLEGRETEGPEAAELRYRLALAALAVAGDSQEADAARLRKDARGWLGEASRTPSEIQPDARRLWTNLTSELGLAAEEPKTFEDAYTAGREAMNALAASKADDEQATREAAARALQAALRLVDEETTPEQLAQVRYWLAYLDWLAGSDLKAAVRAEHVARGRTLTPIAPDAARLAMAALERARTSGETNAANLADRVQRLASYVVGRWPGEAVAEAASSILVSEALRSGDLASAERVLAAVPEDRRAELALRLAVAQWEKVRKQPGDEATDARKRLDAALRSAKETSPATSLQVTAALYLAQAALDAGDAGRALELLQDDRTGPLKRLRAGAPPTDTTPFALSTLSTAIRVAARGGESTDDLCDRLQTLIDDAPEAETGGARAWLALSLALLGDMQRQSSGRDANQVATVLSTTLDRLGPIAEAGDWNTRLWIAHARLRCGEALRDSAASRANVEAGRDALVALIDRAKREPGYAPKPTALMAARLRLAECQRELGQHAEAIDTLAELLSGGATLLDVQRVAAQTLTEWGRAERNVERLEQAITGTRPGSDGKNRLWGWAKLASVAGRFAARDPKRKELFFEAWREVAATRYEVALLASGAKKSEQLRKAASTIRAVQRQHPDLGGEASRANFDELLRKIQAAAGDEATGLASVGS